MMMVVMVMMVFVIVVVVGCVAPLSVVWDVADTFNGLMAIPNLIGVLLLSPVTVKLAKEYFADKK